jgi:hypothetical protein
MSVPKLTLAASGLARLGLRRAVVLVLATAALLWDVKVSLRHLASFSIFL